MFQTDEAILRAKHVQMKYTDHLMQDKHVLGVSVRPVEGYVHKPKEYALVVLVDDNLPAGAIPTTLDDVRVIVQRVSWNGQDERKETHHERQCD